MDCFLDGLVGDGRAPLDICDGAGETDDFDLGAVAPVFLDGQQKHPKP
jgi:hypothetical protein